MCSHERMKDHDQDGDPRHSSSINTGWMTKGLWVQMGTFRVSELHTHIGPQTQNSLRKLRVAHINSTLDRVAPFVYSRTIKLACSTRSAGHITKQAKRSLI